MKRCSTRLLIILALSGMAVSASAQETVVASKPADAKPDNANSFLGSPQRRINAGDYKAPKEFFKDFSPTLPMPRPLYFNNNRSAADQANKQRNWTLLTPEQILGIQTPESILGTKKDNNDQNLSLEDQYLQRLQGEKNDAFTNGSAGNFGWRTSDRNNPFARNNDSTDNSPFANNNPFGRYGNDNSPYSPGRMSNAQQPDRVNTLSQLFNQSGSGANIQQGSDSPWTSPFAQAAQSASYQNYQNYQNQQQQLDAMKRFRALMEPSSQANASVTQSRYPAPSKTTSSSSSSFFQKQPQYNPAGRSVDLLEDNATTPVGLQPLPGVTGPRPRPETQTPSWKPQLPPWMRKGPQPH